MKETLYIVLVMCLGFAAADCTDIVAESVRIEHEYAHRTVDTAVIALLANDE